MLKYDRVYNPTNLGVDIPDPAKLLEAKKDVFTRFVGVLVPLLDLFPLPQSKVHIFYRPPGRMVTFNHNNGIYVSLGHYETWCMHCFLFYVV